MRLAKSILPTAAILLADLTGLAASASSTPPPDNGQCGAQSQQKCCEALRSSAVGDRVFVTGDSEYVWSRSTYYSIANNLNPTCIVLPESAEDVSTVVKTLTKKNLAPSCPFAIRSGGHTMVLGGADIGRGVTIDLSRMNGTTFNADKETAWVGPGARWGDVYETLMEHNRTVPGGRLGSVGVGGFITGGGININSAERGFACDDVVTFEVVLANGTITHATNQTNSDLYRALKGGSGNLGIVTNFEMLAFSQPEIWGGYITYDNSSTVDITHALENFTASVDNDESALLVSFWTYDSSVGINKAETAVYTTQPHPYPAAYQEYYAIPNITSTTRQTTLYDVVTELPDYTNEFRVLFTTLTVKNDARVVQHGVNLYNQFLEDTKASVSGGEYIIIAGFQPFPRAFGRNGLRTGGNLLGLDKKEDDLIVLLFEVFWQHTADDKLFHGLADQLIEDLNEYAVSVGSDSDWLYLNYAAKHQDPIRGYGKENVDFLKKAAKRYDPTGVFQTQMPGGFKVSKVDL
ncbi:hypothetical protein FE257_006543 [Aspergillus nanangensis]|uniref:FAD linked oxidase N-terminal domain-containing protein n=1 Tax=Aspergillus nanangensis TaxID=2582783 RepID=A0AAD4GZE0_ASPNN|nr:hypothetical protein FE257_006543 [Aspergillus nanangensis]QGW49096.1 putative FAD-binding oxidoreductase [Aspergillus nanangensis]